MSAEHVSCCLADAPVGSSSVVVVHSEDCLKSCDLSQIKGLFDTRAKKLTVMLTTGRPFIQMLRFLDLCSGLAQDVTGLLLSTLY
jgi:hypothetical protein